MSVPGLGVMVPKLGAISESFIRRHVDDLHPGHTAVVCRERNPNPAWECKSPVIYASRMVEPKYRMALERFGILPTPTISRVDNFLREHGVQVIMGEFLSFSYDWFRFLGKKYAFYPHAHGIDVSKQLREKLWRKRYMNYTRAAGIIAMSEFSKKDLVELGLPAAKISVVPYGVNVSAMEPSRNTGERVVCLAVGRMVPKKSPLDLLRAFELAAKLNERVFLEYIGDGPLFQEAQDFVREKSLQGRISLHGAQPHHVVKEWMNKADVFVQHSRVCPRTGDMEGLPVGILEAMADGIPVLSTRHAGIPEAVISGETGFLVDEGDWQTMGRHIADIANDDRLRRQFGIAAWRRAKERFSWEAERASLLRVMELPDVGATS